MQRDRVGRGGVGWGGDGEGRDREGKGYVGERDVYLQLWALLFHQFLHTQRNKTSCHCPLSPCNYESS